MKKIAWLCFVYSSIILAGGVFGFLKAGSIASLISGVLFSTLLMITGLSLLKGFEFATHSALILTAFLTIFFGYRFIFTHVWMPSGIMFFISTIVFLLVMLEMSKLRRKKAAK